MKEEGLLELWCYAQEGRALTNEDPILEVFIILDVGNRRMADKLDRCHIRPDLKQISREEAEVPRV